MKKFSIVFAAGLCLASVLIVEHLPHPKEASYADDYRLVGLCALEGNPEKVRVLGVEEDDFPAGIVQPDGTVVPACDWIEEI